MTCPPSSSTNEARGDTVREAPPRCPICKQRITSRVTDPATAQTAKRFLQLMHATDPEMYHDVCRRNPVRRNVLSEIASREILTDFVAHGAAGDRLRDNNVAAQVDRQTYLRWMEQQLRS